MRTTIRSETKTVIIDTEGPFVIIGEKINPTGRYIKHYRNLAAENES